jgi:methylase of polypeptide subunit release factors
LLDMIVANLPYLAASTAADHPDLEGEPFAAVYAAGDGLEPYRRLVDTATARLTEDGILLLQLYRRVVVASRYELPALRAALDRLALSRSSTGPVAREEMTDLAA